MATRRSPIETVLTAIVTTLKNSTGVTGLATGGVYNNVPQRETFPYIKVTSPTDRREDTFGRHGNIALVDVTVVSQGLGDQEGARISSAAVQALNDAAPSLTGHVWLGVEWDNGERFRETINGIDTRHHVNTFRVWTEQTSS